MSSIVYMFHSIGDLDINDSADPHYNYALKKFITLLKTVGPVTSIREALTNQCLDSSIVTFDDGHISNYAAAIAMHEQKIGVADFFVNPNMVGEKDYMTWNQLREISALGMSIQSHSLDHVYLSDCSYAEQSNQLKKSKEIIEHNIGSVVSILAPPGGRYNSDTVKISEKVGYQVITNSKPGVWHRLDQKLIPRIPVHINDSIRKLASCSEKNSLYVRKLKAKYIVTGLAKKSLGNNNYEKLRSTVLGEKN
jgi:peptidoglycan/xylan/chitin deacetylase (PgdA/CDA1 family)